LGAALTTGFALYAWCTPAAEPVRASGLALLAPDDQAGAISARASFDERFVFEKPRAPKALQASSGAFSFDDRFNGAFPVFDSIERTERTIAAAAAPQRPVERPRAASVMPRRDPRSAVANGAKRPPSGAFQLASASETSLALAYAPADSMKNAAPSSLDALVPKDSQSPADIDTTRTAIYDITSRTVYLPNGRRLEAHSGLGRHMDNPRYVSLKNTGPTPPNVYDLKMRESLFHGVRAIRLIPQDESKMYGRDGMLAHTYMLGASGQSNGCISFSDYQAFLDAYERGEVTRLVVVEHLAGVPPHKTASDWISDAVKNLFRRS
jgi:Tlde1 domain